MLSSETHTVERVVIEEAIRNMILRRKVRSESIKLVGNFTRTQPPNLYHQKVIPRSDFCRWRMLGTPDHLCPAR